MNKSMKEKLQALQGIGQNIEALAYNLQYGITRDAAEALKRLDSYAKAAKKISGELRKG